MVRANLSIFITFVTILVFANELNIVQKNLLLRDPGNYSTKDDICKFEIKISKMGGFRCLLIGKEEIKDVTGTAYLGDGKLVYTVSPMYGNPGVYMYNCKSSQSSQIRGAKNKDKGYPLGADYFELESVSGNNIFFYYLPDIDKADFANYKNKGNLFQIDYAGKDFKKASSIKSSSDSVKP